MRNKVLFSSLLATTIAGALMWAALPTSVEVPKAKLIAINLANPDPAALDKLAARFRAAAAHNASRIYRPPADEPPEEALDHAQLERELRAR